MTESIVGGKSYYFALKVIPLYKLMQDQKEYVISNQLLRCSTSIGANIEEATAGISRKDFDFTELLTEIEEIVKILTKIVKTTQLETNLNKET